jgi:hypothetical protein
VPQYCDMVLVSFLWYMENSLITYQEEPCYQISYWKCDIKIDTSSLYHAAE